MLFIAYILSVAINFVINHNPLIVNLSIHKICVVEYCAGFAQLRNAVNAARILRLFCVHYFNILGHHENLPKKEFNLEIHLKFSDRPYPYRYFFWKKA